MLTNKYMKICVCIYIYMYTFTYTHTNVYFDARQFISVGWPCDDMIMYHNDVRDVTE